VTGRIAPVLAALSITTACASSPATPSGPRIAFLFDGSSGDADEVTGPALAGLRFAALGTGDPETIQPVNVGLDPEETAGMLREVADDRRVVAAVVAPWTSPPDGAIQLLAQAGIPVVSLSWAWGPPAEGVWRSLAIDRAREAELLLEAGAPATGPGRPTCLAGDMHATSEPLAGAVSETARVRGATVRPAASRPSAATPFCGRGGARPSSCSSTPPLVWRRSSARPG
jgi:hypothetical protein